MLQYAHKASGFGGLTLLPKEEECAGKQVHLLDDKKVSLSELPLYPNCSSLIPSYLQDNYDLSAVPPMFFQRMYLLQVLDLSHTSIKSLPKSLPKLVALKKLLLRGCDLFMELSPDVGKLKNLEELDLDETQIMNLPRDIGKLLNLRKLRVSFYPISGKKKMKSNILIHPETISILSQLTELSIHVDPADKRWDDSVDDIVKEVCNSKALRTLSLYVPKFQLLDSTSSIYSSLSCFRFIVGRQKRRIISRVPHEVEAEFRNWDKCLKFVNGENIPTEVKVVLKYSDSFFLDQHATAPSLSEFGRENMKRLKCCLLAECNKMETIIDGEMYYEGNEDNQSEFHPNSVENVALESLEYLSIHYMDNLGSVWRGPTHNGCMSKLKYLALHTCPQLSNVFSRTLLENFVNLEELILEDCPLVTNLVSHSSFEPMNMPGEFLPGLKRLLLLYLPELVSISRGILIAPKLESIGFYNCPKLKRISKMELSSKHLKKIRGERQWWEDMRWNETEWGDLPDYLMRLFCPINNEEDVMTQLAEDRDLFAVPVEIEGLQLDYTKEKITGTDVTMSSPPECKLPRSRTSENMEECKQYSSLIDEQNIHWRDLPKLPVQVHDLNIPSSGKGTHEISVKKIPASPEKTIGMLYPRRESDKREFQELKNPYKIRIMGAIKKRTQRGDLCLQNYMDYVASDSEFPPEQSTSLLDQTFSSPCCQQDSSNQKKDEKKFAPLCEDGNGGGFKKKSYGGRQAKRTNENIRKKIFLKGYERRRRLEMKSLCAKLRSLIPHEYSKGKRSISDQMQEAVKYIKHLQNRITELSAERDELKSSSELKRSSSNSPTPISMSGSSSTGNSDDSVEIRVSFVGVSISATLKRGLPLSKVLDVIVAEGLDVLSCQSSRVNERMLHNVKLEVNDQRSIDRSELQEKLAKLMTHSPC